MRRFLGACLALFVLGGCGLLPSTKDRIYTATPVKGQCWQATNKQASDWMDWQGFAPVQCSEKHTLETVAVTTVEGDYPGTGLGGADEYTDEFKNAANSACQNFWTATAKGVTSPSRVLNFLFYPAPEKFAGGERWVRCDVGVYDVGTPWSSAEFALAIFTKPFKVLKSSADLRLCLDSSSDEIGANGEELKVASCGSSHRWDMVRATDLSVTADEEYPGADEVSSRAKVSCTFKKPRSVTGFFWQSPTEWQWLSGDRTSYCWWANAQPETSQALAKTFTPEG